MKKKVFNLCMLLCLAQSMMAQLSLLGLANEANIEKAIEENRVGKNYIPKLEVADGYIYAATPQGLYRYEIDKAEDSTWVKMQITDEQVCDVIVHGDVLLVLTSNALFISTDGGKSSVAIPVDSIAKEKPSAKLQDMAVHPNNADTIFIAYEGLSYTADGGKTWETVNTDIGYMSFSLDGICYNPHDPNQLVGYYNNQLITEAEAIISNDGGVSWSVTYGFASPKSCYDIIFHPTEKDRLIAYGAGLYSISEDGGKHWDRLKNIEAWDIVYDVRNPEILYGATKDGIYRSNDGGLTWNVFYRNETVGEVRNLAMHNNMLAIYTYQEGIYLLDVDAMNKPVNPEPSRELTKRGYGLYYGDTYLYKYRINEREEVNDSTDFAVWNDKSVIYFDVDTVGNNAFTNATFRRGQILYFTEKLKCIMPDAFADIMMLDDEPTEENPFGDLCIVFSGDYVPNIEKNSISDYADTTYHITYVVPDLEAYIAKDIQWTYSQLVTIDDFVKGYISPENEITVNDSTGVDVDVDNGVETNGNVNLTVNARPRKDIPIRIGDGENKDIYSRAPAWMRYTIELKITDTEGKILYTDSKQCSAYDECEFAVSFARPKNNIIYVYSRSIDQFNRASEWVVSTVNLDTAIETILIPDHEAYYDLQGRKVTNPTRGIYIKNGRKVIVE